MATTLDSLKHVESELVGFVFPGDALLETETPLEVRRGLNVLYGLNGAGKSRVLRAIQSALLGVESSANVALVVRIDVEHLRDQGEVRGAVEARKSDYERRVETEAFGRSPAEAIAAAVAQPDQMPWVLPEQSGRIDEQIPRRSLIAELVDEVVAERLGDCDARLGAEISGDSLFMFVPIGTAGAPAWAVWPVADARLPEADAESARLGHLAALAYDDPDSELDHVVELEDETSKSPLFAKGYSEVWVHGVETRNLEPHPFIPYGMGVSQSDGVKPIHVRGRVDFGLDSPDSSSDVGSLTAQHLATVWAGLISVLEDGSERVNRASLEGETELFAPSWRERALRPRRGRDWADVVQDLLARGTESEPLSDAPSWWSEDVPADLDSVSSTMREIVADLEHQVNETLRSVLIDAPEALLDVDPAPTPFIAKPVAWRFGRWRLSIDALSRAERQWAELAIRESVVFQLNALVFGSAPRRAVLSVIDEPESALHRAAEAHMARALRNRGDSGMFLVIATHSPELLDAPEGWITEVKKHGGNWGRSRIEPLRAPEREDLARLGLLPSDLLRRHRVILLVEGQHEEVLLDAFLADRLRAARVKVVPLHGGRRLAGTVDSQVLFTHTDAHVVALLDNLRAERLASVWEVATGLAVRGDVQAAIDAAVEGIPDNRKRKGDEAGYMRGWLTRALQEGLTSRATPYALGEADIIRYLPVSSFVPEADSWSELERRHNEERAAAKPDRMPPSDFKAWMADRFKMTITPGLLRDTATTIETPQDFERLMKTLEAISHSID